MILVQEPSNPIIPGMGETSSIMDGTQLDLWFAGPGTPPYTELYYTYSIDDACVVYAAPVSCLTGIRFPCVVKVDGVYYLFAMMWATGEIHLWQSTDKTTWTMLNDGKPVLTPSAGMYQYIWNVGVVVIGNVWHMLIECGSKLDQSDTGLAYSYSTLEEMNWNTHRTAGAVIPRGGNPNPTYVPDRNAVMVLCGIQGAKWWDIKAFHADVLDLTNWEQCPNFKISYPNMHTADPDLVVTEKSHNIIIRFLYNQAGSYQCYYDGTLNQFYDAANMTVEKVNGMTVISTGVAINPGEFAYISDHAILGDVNIYYYSYGSPKKAKFFCGANETQIMDGTHAVYANSDVDGKVCVYYDATAGKLAIKNNTGAVIAPNIILNCQDGV